MKTCTPSIAASRRPAVAGLVAGTRIGVWIGSALRRVAALTLATLLAWPFAVQSLPATYDLSFSTSGQSIWGSGDAFILDETKFIGVAWQDQNAGVNLIVGDDDTNLLNPLRVTYDAAFRACTGLGFSASACISGQSARAPVPALGSRPSVRSCGTFEFSCQAARLVDLARRATYDAAFATCQLGFSATVCRSGQTARLPVIALGTAPAQYINIDTRTGVAANANTDGRVGLELGVAIDSGSVDATVSYQVSLEIPDTLVDTSRTINFNPQSALAGTNTLNTSFSSIELSVDAIMELSGSVSAEACALLTGCAAASSPFAIAERAPILSFNEDGEGGILFLGQTPSDLGIPLDGFPVDLDVAGLATATLHLPQPNASGGLDAASGKLTATGQDDLADLILDLDNIVATAAGVPGLFGSSFDIPLLGSVGYDIINVEMGPTIDLKQEFELEPTLYVDLVFDRAVMIGGNIVTAFRSAWDFLPSITFLDDITTVTPTFFLEASLLNRTLLDFDLAFGIDLLQVFYDFGLLGEGQFGIGNVLNRAVDLFQSPALFSSLFGLGGFNLQVGDSFVIDFVSGARGPATSVALTAFDEIALPSNPNVVPEPTTILLLALALVGVAATQGRRRRFASGGHGQ